MVLMSENALPGIDGRWTSSKHAGVKTIQGKTLYWGFGMQFGINYLPMERLSYDHMGMTRKGMLAGNKIDWNDDDCWTRQQNDPYSTTETLRLGARLAANSIGFCCHKGFKPEIPNQDNWSIVHVNGDFSVYTICDGHGLSGHHVADVTKDSLPRLLLQDPRFRRQRRDALVDAFENTQDLLRTADRQGLVKAAVGGTTATVVVHDHAEQKLQVAHVGDSAAVLGRMGQAEQFLAVPLTRARGHGARPSATRPRKRVVELDRADHHLEAEDERHRVEAVGARVEWEAGAYRAFNKHGTGAGLNVTRSLGDLDAHVECGISSEPEVILRLKKGKEVLLAPEDKVLVVASDGVWTWMKPQAVLPREVLDIVAACGAAQPTVAAERVAKDGRFRVTQRIVPRVEVQMEAYERWMQQTGRQAADDIVVLIIDLAARDRKDFA
ncbi:Probable protein phosphatase 2C 35 (AtPP2C35) [Durusdinium trenchii]|uniref:Probable protein phosphatase 2C 35 (AtPP2C35) n=1 Tax=Durusdinium trenchii TaxID=1381693 RepID=A0ABP0LMV2_9DINO